MAASSKMYLAPPSINPSLTDVEEGAVGREDGATASRPAEWKPQLQEWLIMVTLALCSVMVALDATILVPVLPTMALELQGTTTDAFWTGTSYLLTSAVFQPFIAALSDIFGRKEALFASLIFFTLGTALCAPIAKDFATLFAGRSIQGIGGGGIITMGQVIFADIVPLRQRPKYFSLVLGAWALGSVLGPLVGGAFVQNTDWRWCFYINFPFCALGLVMVPTCVRLTTKKTSLMSKLRRVDWVGGFLFIGGLTSFLVGLSWAGTQYAWGSAQTMAPIVVGLVAVIASLVWERFGAVEPFLRKSLYYCPSAIAAYTNALLHGFGLFCALYYNPFYYTAVQFGSPLRSGIFLLPVTVLLLPGSIVVSILTTRLGRFRWAVWIGWTLTTLGCGLLQLFDENTPVPVWAVILAIYGVGNGMVLTSVNVAIQAISRVEDAGRAAAMYAFKRSLGMSIGVAVGSTVFQNVMASRLAELGLPGEIAENAEAFVDRMAQLPPDDPLRVGALDAYVTGFHGVFWLITGTTAFALVTSCFIRGFSMDKGLESAFVVSRDPSWVARHHHSSRASGIDMPMAAVAPGPTSLPPSRAASPAFLSVPAGGKTEAKSGASRPASIARSRSSSTQSLAGGAAAVAESVSDPGTPPQQVPVALSTGPESEPIDEYVRLESKKIDEVVSLKR